MAVNFGTLKNSKIFPSANKNGDNKSSKVAFVSLTWTNATQEILERGAKYIQNWQDIKTTSLMSLSCLYS